MQLNRSLSLILLIATAFSAACGSRSGQQSPTGALTANTSLNAPLRPFDRQMLMVSGLHSLNEFIRQDVRSRIDEEAVGDADSSYDPSTIDVSPSSDSAEQPEIQKEAKPDEEQQQPNGYDEDTSQIGVSDSGKFLWAKKSFGEAVKSSATANAVIVLYADENLYDIHALMSHVEEGRNRIAQDSEIPGARVQILYGGYRGAPQVEFWILPEGAQMPEFKPEDRSKAIEPEN